MFNAQPLTVIETNRWLACCSAAVLHGPRFELRNAEKLQIVVSGLREAMHPTPPLAFSRNLRKNGDVSACQYCQCMSSNVKRDPSRYQDTMK